MELIIAILVLVVAIGTYWYRKTLFDKNKDGKVDMQELKDTVQPIVEKVEEQVTKVADVNKDGVVDSKDAKEVVKEVKTRAKKVATKAKEKVEKVVAKPATKARKPKITVAK